VNMYKDVSTFVKGCEDCLHVKKGKDSRTLLHPIIAKHPWEIVGMDIIGRLPTLDSEEKKYFLIVADYYTKWVELLPLRTQKVEEVWRKLEKHVFSHFTYPKLIVTDAGVQFTSKFFHDQAAKHDVVVHNTAPEHQQGNGQAERIYQSLQPSLDIE